MNRLTDTSSRLRWLAMSVLAAALLAALLPLSTAAAQTDAPFELDYLCVERDDKVVQATSPDDCKRREVSVDVPTQRPVHLCGRDDFGLVRYTLDPADCTRDHEFPITIPDDGPVILCSKNIKHGRVQPTGELRFADSVARCDSQFYTPFITPAAPQANPDTYTVDEDSVLDVVASGVLDNDADASGGPLTARLVDDVASGLLTFNADGSFSFDTNGEFQGLDVDQTQLVTFTYATSDGELESAPTTVTITVTGRNDRATANPDSYTTSEDQILHVSQPGVLGNDTDTETAQLTAHLVDGVSSGQLDLGTDGSFVYDPSGQFEALGAGDSTDVTFTYVARDGSDDSDATPVTITVTGVNDAPVAAGEAFTTDENTPLTIATADLLVNDTDAEGSALTVEDIILGTPAGSMSVNGDGSVTLDPTAVFDSLEDGQTGTATFSYVVSDGVAASARVTVTITVTGISGPTAVDDSASTDEDTPVEIDILGNDTVAGAAVTITSQGSNGGQVVLADGIATYDPAGSFDHLPPGSSDLDTFTYALANDEGTSQATVSVVVEGVNDAPVAAEREFNGVTRTDPFVVDPPGLLVNPDGSATDPDNPTADLSAILVSPPERGRLTLNADGSFTFDPSGDFPAGEEVDELFRYRLTDGVSESATALVTLSSAVDAIPTVLDQAVSLVLEQPFSYQVQASDTDQDGNDTTADLTYALAQPSTYFQVSPDGIITTTQGDPPVDVYPVPVTVTDRAGQSATATVTINAVVAFDPMDDAYQAIGNTPLEVGTVPAPGSIAVTSPQTLLLNDGDVAAIEFTTTPPFVITTALGGQVTVHDHDGSFTYRSPRPGDAGNPAEPCPAASAPWDGDTPAIDCFTYTVRNTNPNVDGDTATAVASIQLTDVVWYVDPAATAPGLGTAEAPYTGLESLDGSDLDTTGDVIYVLGGTAAEGADGRLDLEDDQQLLGRAADLAPGGTLLVAGDAALQPTVSSTVGLADSNTLRGFIINGADQGAVGGAVGDAVIDLEQITVNTAPALQLGTGDVQVNLGPLQAAGGGDVVDITDTRGAIVIEAVTATGAIRVTGTPASAVADPVDTIQIGTVTTVPAVGDVVDIDGWPGAIDIGVVTAEDVAGTIFTADNLPLGASVDVGLLTATGGINGISALENNGDIYIDEVQIEGLDLAGSTRRGLIAVDNNGSLIINDGLISAPTPPLVPSAPGFLYSVLMEVRGAPDGQGDDDEIIGGILRNDADLVLGDPAAGPSGSAARAMVVTSLDNGDVVEQAGMVTSRGAGLLFTGNDRQGSLLTLSGGSDIQTTPYDAAGDPVDPEDNPGTLGGVGMFVNISRLALTGAGHSLSSVGGPALRLISTTSGPEGILVTNASSVGARFVDDGTGQPLNQTLVGVGVDLLGVATGAADQGPVTIQGGQIAQPGVLGVRVQEADGVTIGAVAVTEPKSPEGLPASRVIGAGVLVTNSDGVLLRGTSVQRATGDGVSANGQSDLTLDGVTVSNSDGRGVYLPTPGGVTTLIGSSVNSSQLQALEVTYDGQVPPTGETIGLNVLDSTFAGSPAEVDTARVTVSDGSVVAIDVGGANASAFTSGRNSLYIDATSSAQVDLSVSRTQFAGSSGDGLRIRGEGSSTTVTYQLADIHPDSQGGFTNNGRAGAALVSRGGAALNGTIERVQAAGSGEYGVLLDRADGAVLDQVDVFGAAQVSIGIQNTDGVFIDRADIEGAPEGHGIELWGSRNVTIQRSRVDFRNLPDQPGPDVDGDGEPLPDDEQTIRQLDSVADTCTNNTRAAGSTNFFGNDNVPPLVVDGVSGIFARHTSGHLTITDTTVRGASLHQITVWNGIAQNLNDGLGGDGRRRVFANNAVPGVEDPVDRPTLRYSVSAPVTLNLGDLQLLDSDLFRAGLFAGASGLGVTNVVYLPGSTGELEAAHVLCSTDGGTTDVTGSFGFEIVTFDSALVIKASGPASIVTYDITDVQISYPENFPQFIIDFLQAFGLDTLFALQIIEEDGGQVDGDIGSVVINNPPGNGLLVTGANDEYDTYVITNPAGDGVIVRGATNAVLTNITVTEPGGVGYRVEDSDTVSFTTASVSAAPDEGVVVTDSSAVSFNGLTVTDPGLEAVRASSTDGLTIEGGTLSATAAGADGPRSAINARNVLSLGLNDLTITGFDALPVDILNGSAYAGAGVVEPLPCASTPCSGTVRIGALTTSGTPSGEPAVWVRSGTDVTPEVQLAGAGGDLDGRLEITSDDSDVSVTTAGATMTIDGGAHDALHIAASNGGELDVNLTGLDLSATSQADAIGIVGSTSTTLANPTIRGASTAADVTGDALNVDSGPLVITGGSIGTVSADGINHTGPSLTLGDADALPNPIAGPSFTPVGGNAITSTAIPASGSVATITGPLTIDTPAGSAIALTDYVDITIRDVTVDDPGGESIVIAGTSGQVDIDGNTVNLPAGVNGTSFRIDGTGGAQCTRITLNTVNGTGGPAYRLTALELDRFNQPGNQTESEAAADWLSDNDNTPNTVEATNVARCTF